MKPTRFTFLEGKPGLRGSRGFVAAFGMLLGLTAPFGAKGDELAPVRIQELKVRVRAGEQDTGLRIRAQVAFEAPLQARELRFRLAARYPLERIADEEGREFQFSRRGDVLEVRDERPGAVRRSLTFEYTLPLFAKVLEAPVLFSHTGWLPSEPDRETAPGNAAPTQARIEVELPEPLVALVPGTASVRATAGGRTFEFHAVAVTHPLVAGRFAWRERQAGPLAARVLLPEPLAGAEALLDLLLGSASFFTARFGPAPLADHALAVLPLGRGQRGITFPGLVVLAAADVADPGQFSPRILAHEVAHQWWSLAVRLPRSEDAWLAEGLPTYSALLFLEDLGGAARLREELENSRGIALSTRQAPPLRLGAGMPGSARYTQNYHKAALVLHMLRSLIGRDTLLEVLRHLYTGFAGRDMATSDFVRAASERAGEDLGPFLEGWLDATELPRFEVSWRAGRAQGSGAHVISGTIKRMGARVSAPVRLRVLLESGASEEAWVRVASPSTPFNVTCPEPVRDLLVDPEGDLLHGGLRVRRERR